MQRSVIDVTARPLSFDGDNDGPATKWGIVSVIDRPTCSLFAEIFDRLSCSQATFVGVWVDVDGEVDKFVRGDAGPVGRRYRRRRAAQLVISPSEQPIRGRDGWAQTRLGNPPNRCRQLGGRPIEGGGGGLQRSTMPLRLPAIRIGSLAA